jgi:ABC-2 type transport system ATP-binding protein
MKRIMSNIIDVKNLIMVYSDGTRAIDDVSFEVGEGEFFGFLGPNGAGKSTAIKVLTTLLKKTSGAVSVAGFDIEKDGGEIRKMIGVQSQETAIDGELTGKENLMLQGHLQRIRGKLLEDRVTELLKLMDLSNVAEKKAAFYSGGMKKRLDLASALVHRPKILFLDEPTTGLDPQSRASIWAYLKELNKQEGLTIFLTTQYMEEADRLCQKLSIIDHGKLVISGTPAELKQQVGGDTLTVTLPSDSLTEEVKKSSIKIAMEIPGVSKAVAFEEGLTVYAKNGGNIVPELVRAFDEGNIPLASVTFASPSLDDVFLQQTGRRIRPEELSRNPTTSSSFGMRFGRRR